MVLLSWDKLDDCIPKRAGPLVLRARVLGSRLAMHSLHNAISLLFQHHLLIELRYNALLQSPLPQNIVVVIAPHNVQLPLSLPISIMADIATEIDAEAQGRNTQHESHNIASGTISTSKSTHHPLSPLYLDNGEPLLKRRSPCL